VTTLAFAGAGPITVVHSLAAQALRMPITHVAAGDSATARQRADQVGATPCTYGDLPAGADIVLVAAPPTDRAAAALHALRAGAAVIVEPPLCTTLQDADDLVQTAAGAEHRLGYGENLAFAPIVARAVAERRRLGPLTHLDVRSLRDQPEADELVPADHRSGVLFEVGSRLIALAILLASPQRATEVTARLRSVGDGAIDEHAEVSVRFDDGLVAHIEASTRPGPSVWDLQAASNAGVVRAELLPRLSLERDGEPVRLPPSRTAPATQLDQFGYLQQLEAFEAAFAEGRRPALDAEFGREVLDLVCAAYRSAGRAGRTEPVPFAGPRDVPASDLGLTG
jgi:myo-inositol 2-dehydrogenase / D-chiro-inositol 1-dehydrogenase